MSPEYQTNWLELLVAVHLYSTHDTTLVQVGSAICTSYTPCISTDIDPPTFQVLEIVIHSSI